MPTEGPTVLCQSPCTTTDWDFILSPFCRSLSRCLTCVHKTLQIIGNYPPVAPETRGLGLAPAGKVQASVMLGGILCLSGSPTSRHNNHHYWPVFKCAICVAIIQSITSNCHPDKLLLPHVESKHWAHKSLTESSVFWRSHKATLQRVILSRMGSRRGVVRSSPFWWTEEVGAHKKRHSHLQESYCRMSHTCRGPPSHQTS